jgi:predicted ribosome quality control (RQC) complex YloA/Tae2 family protein
MDLAILQKVALELNEILPGGFINKIHQPLPREIVLRIRVLGGGEKMLVISSDPKLGRIHLIDLKIPNPPRPPRFCAFLRAHLQGARIIEVKPADNDRVVTIRALRGHEENLVERNLVLELLGRDSNILLIDKSSNLIMDCLHRIPEKKTGRRIVLPGCHYSPPPERVRPAVPADFKHTEMGHIQPAISTGTDGQRRLALRVVSPKDITFSTMNRAADAFFRPVVQSGILDALKRQVAGPLKTRIRSLERRTMKIETDRNRLLLLAALQEGGELLKANLTTVKKGMESIDLQDWNSQSLRTIKLNPALDAVANMNRIFAKAAKGRRGEQFIQQRLQDTLEEKRALEDLLFFVEESANQAELERHLPELSPADDKGKSGRLTRKNHEAASVSNLFREFRMPSGKIVLVGKSGKGNDFILIKKARKGDLWLHAKGFPGAHVILPHSPGGSVSNKDLNFAAGLAVYFSKARKRGKVEVMVADVKDVRRAKGAIPGQVSVKSYRSILAESHSDAGCSNLC